MAMTPRDLFLLHSHTMIAVEMESESEVRSRMKPLWPLSAETKRLPRCRGRARSESGPSQSSKLSWRRHCMKMPTKAMTRYNKLMIEMQHV